MSDHPKHTSRSYLEVIEQIFARWTNYRASSVNMAVSDADDMLIAGHLDHYLSVGTSALEAISEAMILARKTHVGSVLDMPCGYGRVTRHLVKFFPDSQISVSEIDKAKQQFCESTFGASGIDLAPDFAGEPPRQFDLIFVGSLLTHLDEELFTRAIRYLLKALLPAGLLVVTTHGRHATAVGAKAGQVHPKTLRNFVNNGFAYEGPPDDGASRTAPSWLLRMLESLPDVRMLGYKEQGWADFQDVFVIERAPLDALIYPRPVKPRWFSFPRPFRAKL